jgi:hypothetical protein
VVLEVVGLAVRDSDELGYVVLRVSVRHETDGVSSVGLGAVVCDVVDVRSVHRWDRSGVGDPSADSSVCDVRHPHDQEEGVGRHHDLPRSIETTTTTDPNSVPVGGRRIGGGAGW